MTDPGFQIFKSADYPVFKNPRYNCEVLSASEDALCVYCRQKPADPGWKPFCSERCKMADLGRWLTGGYTVAGQPVSERPPDGEDDAHER